MARPFEFNRDVDGCRLQISIERGLGGMIPNNLADATWICTHMGCGTLHLLFPGYGTRNWGKLGRPSEYLCQGYGACVPHQGTIVPLREFVERTTGSYRFEIINQYLRALKLQEEEYANEERDKNGPARSRAEVEARAFKLCAGCGVPVRGDELLCGLHATTSPRDASRHCFWQFVEFNDRILACGPRVVVLNHDSGGIWEWIQRKTSELAQKKHEREEFVDGLATDKDSCKKLCVAIENA